MLLTTPLPDLTALDDTASRKAQAFLAEAATEQWVYDCNTKSLSSTFCDGHVFEVGGGLPWPEAGHGCAKTNAMVNKWVQRWQARWGVRRKVLKQVVSRGPRCTARQGAGQPTYNILSSFFWVGWLHFWGRNVAPKNGSPLMFHACISLLNPGWAVPFLGPESGTKK